ncbi:MAG: HIT family protein [Nanoarchaeota archaeon]|nr:HIT family protein [Nanoarchaeota archaeon]
MECLTCSSVSRRKKISPGPIIYESRYWLVDHAYPCRLTGWLVIILKRHCSALHELTREEFIELGEATYKAVNALHDVLGCEKEYSVCFAEKEGFNHIHFHIVPRAVRLSDDLKGANIFSLLKSGQEDAVPEKDVIAICNELKMRFSQKNK